MMKLTSLVLVIIYFHNLEYSLQMAKQHDIIEI